MIKTDKPLVSILIAAYNEEKYICECINSCLAQTYRNIEIIVTDDGSTDRTIDVIKANFEKEGKVKLFTFETNRGKVAAFNNCYENSSGAYIALMGADDIAFSNRIEVSLNSIGESSNMVCGDLIKFSEEGILSTCLMNKNFGITDNCIFTFDSLLNQPKVYGGTILGTREIFKNIFPIPESLSHEDWWIPLSAAVRQPIKYIAAPLIKYRIHDSNSSKSKKKLSYEDWKELYTRDNSYYELVLDTFTLSHEQQCLIMYKRLITKLPSLSAYKRINATSQFIKSGIHYRLRIIDLFKLMILTCKPLILYKIFKLRNFIHKLS